jgi:hypothetical protein
MFTAATLALLAPILGTGAIASTVAQAVAFLATPAGRVCRLVLKEVIKSFGKPLTEEQQVRLARYNYAIRVPMTKQQFNKYVYGK